MDDFLEGTILTPQEALGFLHFHTAFPETVLKFCRFLVFDRVVPPLPLWHIRTWLLTKPSRSWCETTEVSSLRAGDGFSQPVTTELHALCWLFQAYSDNHFLANTLALLITQERQSDPEQPLFHVGRDLNMKKCYNMNINSLPRATDCSPSSTLQAASQY